MDPSVAIIVGVLIGGVLTWAISLFQRNADREARAVERKYERLHAAARLIRLSVIQAGQLNYSRSLRGLPDMTAWPSQRWAQFARTLTDAGAALALVSDELPQAAGIEYETAAEALLNSNRADQKKLERYTKAALALNGAVEARTRALR